MNTVIVTRHPALIDLLRERGMVKEDCCVIEHATADDIRGKDVIGILPLSLAMLANSVTEIELNLTPELRGRELDLNTLRQVAGKAVTYTVFAATPERLHDLLQADGYSWGIVGLRSALHHYR
ncbi:MAG: hypothetical protein KGI50_07150 [Patescibacteria group bacterium]|nr:hypothetical protein [Patescibacteria group bacterium]MDE2439143.1 hypothetical protein [Patescibacteria group bacterium]